MAARRDSWTLPALLAIALHAAAGGGLYAAGELLDDDEEDDDGGGGEVEVEILPPAEPDQAEDEPEDQPEDQPEDEPETVAVTEPETRTRTRTDTKPRTRTRATTTTTTTTTTHGGDGTGEPAEPLGDGTEVDETGPILKGGLDLPKGIGGDGFAQGDGGGGGGGRGAASGGGGGDGDGGGGAAPVSVAAIVERAKPIGGLDFVAIGKAYPPEARRLGIEGKVRVFLVVSAEGRVVRRRLLTRLGYGLDELALTLAADLEFRPARDADGRAVADKVTYTFTFRLPE